MLKVCLYSQSTPIRVELTPEQWNSQPQPLGVIAFLPTPHRKSPMQNPEVARNSVIVQQPPGLAPTSQIRTREEIL